MTGISRLSGSEPKNSPMKSAGRSYSDLDASSIPRQPAANLNLHLTLTHWLPVYDWVAHQGFENFASWIS
ncbi:MAG TPA: hypothetical protein VHW24_23520 [Bryobacteraceae bacterium]|nr:hypothetical protein [Bryobacteraceae bacterium]